MLNSSSVRLELADPGWLQIDEAALRVNGALDAIVREMQMVLSDQPVRSLCSQLGIFSSGFLFIDPNRGWTRYFFEKDERDAPKTYRTQYLWLNEAAGSRWSDLVHWVFVHVRTTQATHAEAAGRRTEDYFRHIPKDGEPDRCLSEEDRIVRRRYSLHYATLGEMLFTIVAWRCLAVAVQLSGQDLALCRLSVGLDREYGFLRTCSWDGIDLIGLNGLAGTNMCHPDLREAWLTLCHERASLRSEWALLGMPSVASNELGVERQALRRFAAVTGVIDDSPAAELCSDDDLNTAIQGSIAGFLRRLGVVNEPSTIGEALITIERHARFPLLPFYIWHALDAAPKCYFVNPVWTSQQYSVEVEGANCRSCRHLGLALSAVAPLRRIDWTLPNDLSPFDATRCSNADPNVVANVIRLMARPLVEEHLYTAALRELKERLREQVREETLATVKKHLDENDTISR